MKRLVDLLQEAKKKDSKEFDRVKFYLEYFKNIAPTEFEIKQKNDTIVIKISK